MRLHHQCSQGGNDQMWQLVDARSGDSMDEAAPWAAVVGQALALFRPKTSKSV